MYRKTCQTKITIASGLRATELSVKSGNLFTTEDENLCTDFVLYNCKLQCIILENVKNATELFYCVTTTINVFYSRPVIVLGRGNRKLKKLKSRDLISMKQSLILSFPNL
jgi:hypothetical protein